MWLSSRYLLRNLTQTLTLICTFAIVGLLAAVTATTLASGPRALADGRAAFLAQHQFQINVVDGKSSTHHLISESPGVISIWSSPTTLSANSRLLEGQVHRSTQLVKIGTMLSGRHPDGSGETAISKEASDVLGVAVGDDVHIAVGTQDSAARIVGVYTIEDDLTVIEALLYIDEAPEGVHPSRYLKNSQFEVGSGADEANEARRLIKRDLSSLVAFAAEAHVSEWQNQYRLGAGISIVVSALLSALVASLYVRSSRGAGMILERLGMTLSGRRRLFFVGAAVPSGAGFGMGLLSGAATAGWWAPAIATPANQYWSSTPMSWGVVSAHGAVVATVFGVTVLSRSRNRREAINHQPLRPAASMLVGLSMAWIGIAAVLKIHPAGFMNMAVRFGLSVAAAIGLLIVVFSVQGMGRPAFAALGLVRAKIGRAALGTAAASTVVVLVACCVSLTILRDVATERAQPTSFLLGLPVGSFQIENVDMQTANLLADEFSKRGGESWIHELVVDTPDRQVRVVNRSAVECLSLIAGPTIDDLFACAGDSPVDTVSTGWSGLAPKLRTLASPELLVGGDGTIGIVEINPNTQHLRLSVIDAEVSEEGFSQYLSGAILAPEAQTMLEVEPSGVAALSLNGLSYIDAGAAAEMRAIIRSEAGALVLNDDPGPQDNGRTLLAILIVLIGALVAFSATLAWGKAFTTSNFEMTLALRRLLRGSKVGSSIITKPLLGLGLSGLLGCAGASLFVGYDNVQLIVEHMRVPVLIVMAIPVVMSVAGCLVVMAMVHATEVTKNG